MCLDPRKPGAAPVLAAAGTKPLRGLLPLALPFPCPICGAEVAIHAVTEWGTDDGVISGCEYDCETEPDIDSEEWEGWFRGHYAMPYVDWLPWETKMMRWLNRNYHYRDAAGRTPDAE